MTAIIQLPEGNPMRRAVHVLILALALLFFGLGAAMAQTNAYVDGGKLAELFPKLQNAKDPAEAQGIADQIWEIWLNPTDAELADRMKVVIAARQLGSYHHAIDLLGDIIADYPDYAEAWNQRATLYFMLGEYDKSLDDVTETLKREPRHFGALSGEAVIYQRLGEPHLARDAIIEGLKYHPFLPERELFPELLDRPTNA